MERKKSYILSRRPESIIFMFLIGLVSVLLNFTFSQNSFAEYKATLSASVNEDIAAIDGTEVIESDSETAEHAINLKVKTTNKTGYTATLSAKTDETALLNTNPAITTKISSISSASSLSNLPTNTWGYRFDDDIDFSPILAQSAPVNLIKTTEKSNSEENHTIKLGMRLNSSLKPGNYENKLIISVVSNLYTPKAVMAKGRDFNKKLRYLGAMTDKIERFKKSTVAPAASMNAVNIEDEESDYEIKLWLDPADKTAYYYTEMEKVYLNTDSSEMFYSDYVGNKIEDILDLDLSNFDTSQVTNMKEMFDGMRNLTTLDLSNFDTSQVTNMSWMFANMRSLTTLNLSNFDTSNVKLMYSMFRGMSSLISLDLSSFDTSKVRDMQNMFSGISSLTSLDLSNFDTSNVTSMYYMFANMSNLTTIDLSNFDTSKVTTMSHMFHATPNLTSLDLSNFDTSQVTDMQDMFSLYNQDESKDKLETIYVNNDFNTTNLTYYYGMFTNRKKLRGGNGSFLADPRTADETWLRIDDPANGRPGYFTRKS